MKRTIIFCYLVMIIVGCKKSSDENNYTIHGLVLDLDSKLPIGGAKVYVSQANPLPTIIDSAITDAAGKVSFQYNTNSNYVYLSPSKTGYLVPPFIFFISRYTLPRTDTLFLARPSYFGVNLHKANSYQGTDSLYLKLYSFGGFDYNAALPPVASQNYQLKIIANAADTTFQLAAIYPSAPFQKVYLYWDIVRNGNIISSNSDSTELVQFGIKNYNINY